ncbi:hypothetical protein B0H13DRAFT_2300440 [Mycena leptocephala]|nr:hypothetical protein B0H13DRAFT_2300440 [Mycena leptocephala]
MGLVIDVYCILNSKEITPFKTVLRNFPSSGPAQVQHIPNLELDPGFGSGISQSLNRTKSPFQVRFRFASHGRFETGFAKLASQSLKDDGIISTEIRACVRDTVSFGAPLESVRKIIHAVAKGLNIQIMDNISTRSEGRIVLEGGVAALLKIVDAVKDADHPIASGDGTSHKHLNYESRFITVKQKFLALGLTQAPNHTSEEQMAGWLKLIEEMYATYNAAIINASPMGRAYPEDFPDGCAEFGF